MTLSLIYFTIDTLDKARDIANTLLEQNLVKCVNIIPGMLSLYKWQDKTAEEQEVIVLAKTTESLVVPAMSLIKTLHHYQCPAIFTINTDIVDDDFLKWLRS